MASDDDSAAHPLRSVDGEDWITPGGGLTRRYAGVCGFQMSYVTGGHGEPIVLLHGLGSDSGTWRRILPELAQHYTVYAPDMFGCGLSDKPKIAYTIEAMAHYIRLFMDAVEIERAHLIGHSLGGGIAMQTVYFSEDRVHRVVLVDSGGLGHDLHWLLRISTLPGANLIIGLLTHPRSGVITLAQRLERRRHIGEDSDYESLVPLILRRLRELETRQSFLRMIRAVGNLSGQKVSALPLLTERAATPFLLIWGEKDRIIPPTHAYAARARIPNSLVAVIPDSYHQPHIESPEQFCRLTLDFLQEPEWPRGEEAALASALQAPRLRYRSWRIATLLAVVTGVPAGLALFLSTLQRRRLSTDNI
jgi:pimeloyl-ACP methyl ester carboxylesterase